MAKTKSDLDHADCWYGGARGSVFWGLLLLVIGGYFLAREVGLIASDFPFWPLVLMFFGLWLLVKGLVRRS